MAGSVLVLTLDGDDELAAHLRSAGVAVSTVQPAPGNGAEVSRLCLAVANAHLPAPVSIIAVGAAATHVPAVALSLRTSHRRIAEYVLVDAEAPTVTDSWPDAPVSVVVDDPETLAANHARLRDWRTITRAELSQWRPASDWTAD